MNANRIAVISLLLPLLASSSMAAELEPRLDVASCAAPKYKESWRADGEQGAVALSVQVDKDGSVTSAKMLESSGYPVLDHASVIAIMRCKFTPLAQDGVPHASTARIDYRWVITTQPD